MIGWRSRAALGVGALVLAGAVGAHELRPLIATLEAGRERFELTVSLNLEAAIAGIGAGHSETTEGPAASEYDALRTLDPAALRAELDGFSATLTERIELVFDGTPAALRVVRASVPEAGDLALARISELVLAGPVPASARSVTWRVDERLGDSIVRIVSRDDTGAMRSAYVLAGERAGPFELADAAPASALGTFVRYLEIGFVHIVPRGVDHILFVVGLFLLSTRMASLVWQITAFTLAHTVTLALGALGIVALSPAIVEPLIAASIVYVAIENLVTDRLHRWRPVVVFCFGLLHGLGFAGVLGEVGLPAGAFLTGLVAFNVGVELGQLAVIGACFVLVGWARPRTSYRRAVVVPGSAGIAVVGAWWLVERLALA